MSWLFFLSVFGLTDSPILGVPDTVFHVHEGKSHTVRSLLSTALTSLPFCFSSRPPRPIPDAILSQTHPRVCHHHLCFHLVWLSGSFNMFRACIFHLVVLLQAQL